MSEEALTAALQAELGDGAKEIIDDKTQKQSDIEVPKGTTEDSGSGEQSIDLDDTEIEARAMGWDPDKDGYEKRTGRKWTSAETFLAKRELSNEVSRRGKEIKDLNKKLDRLQKHMDDRVAEEVARRVDALKKERADAIRNQDFEEIDRLDVEIDKAREVKQEQSQSDEDADAQPVQGSGYIETPQQVMRFVEKWKKEEAPWFDKVNDSIRKEAARVEQVYMATFPNSSVEDAMTYVKETMTKKFPELAAFGKKVQTGGAPRGGGSASVVDESSLTQQDKQVLALLEKQGVFKDAKERATFIRDTFGEKA